MMIYAYVACGYHRAAIMSRHARNPTLPHTIRLPVCRYTIYDTNGKTLPTDPQYAIRFALCTNIDPVAASIPQCASTTGSDGSVRLQRSMLASWLFTAECIRVRPTV